MTLPSPFLDNKQGMYRNVVYRPQEVHEDVRVMDGEALYTYYASNTGIPGPYRPRPSPTQTPTFEANGLNNLFHSTQSMRYATRSGKPFPETIPLQDEVINKYNILGGRQEKCGCGGMPLLLS